MMLSSTYEILPSDTLVPNHTEVQIASRTGDDFIAFSAPDASGLLDAVSQLAEDENNRRRDYGVVGDVQPWPIASISGIIRIREA